MELLFRRRRRQASSSVSKDKENEEGEGEREREKEGISVSGAVVDRHSSFLPSSHRLDIFDIACALSLSFSPSLSP